MTDYYSRGPRPDECRDTLSRIRSTINECPANEKAALDKVREIRAAIGEQAGSAFKPQSQLPVMQVRTQVKDFYDFPAIKSRAVVDDGKFVEFVIGEQVRINNIKTLQNIHRAIGDFLNAIGEGEAKYQSPATEATGLGSSGC